MIIFYGLAGAYGSVQYRNIASCTGVFICAEIYYRRNSNDRYQRLIISFWKL